MEIDDQVEPLVREALAAVVGKDPDRLQRAIVAFPNDGAMTKGVHLACALVLYGLDDLFEGSRPTDEQIRDLAGDVVKSEAWTDVSADEVVRFFTAVYNRVRLDTVFPVDRMVILAYVIAANFVSSYHNDDEEWWDYLDRAEATLEARSEP